MRNESIANQMKAYRIVTEQNGSWKWQDAFREVEYHASLFHDKVLWVSGHRGPKCSGPQLRRSGINHPHGSLHHKQVRRTEAIKQVGKLAVKKIEDHGWYFGD